MSVQPLAHLFHSATNLCGNCGNPHHARGVFVLDSRVDFLCKRCAASFDWAGWLSAQVAGAPDVRVYVALGSRAAPWWLDRHFLKINF